MKVISRPDGEKKLQAYLDKLGESVSKSIEKLKEDETIQQLQEKVGKKLEELEKFVEESVKKISNDVESDTIKVTIQISEKDLYRILKILKDMNIDVEFVTE